MTLPLFFCHWGTVLICPGGVSDLPPCIFTANGPYSSTEKNFSFGLRFDSIDVISFNFSRYRGSLLVRTFFAFLNRNPASLIIVPLGDWEKNPRLQAKTLVCLRYGKVP